MDRKTRGPVACRRTGNWLHILLQYWLTMSLSIPASECCVFLFLGKGGKREKMCKEKIQCNEEIPTRVKIWSSIKFHVPTHGTQYSKG